MDGLGGAGVSIVSSAVRGSVVVLGVEMRDVWDREEMSKSSLFIDLFPRFIENIYLLQYRRLLFRRDEIRNIVKVWWKASYAESLETLLLVEIRHVEFYQFSFSFRLLVLFFRV
jgi:hypothetical protein